MTKHTQGTMRLAENWQNKEPSVVVNDDGETWVFKTIWVFIGDTLVGELTMHAHSDGGYPHVQNLHELHANAQRLVAAWNAYVDPDDTKQDTAKEAK